jgi:hypothetical protein
MVERVKLEKLRNCEREKSKGGAVVPQKPERVVGDCGARSMGRRAGPERGRTGPEGGWCQRRERPGFVWGRGKLEAAVYLQGRG